MKRLQLAALLAVLVFPASAGASTAWFHNEERTPIPEGETVVEPSTGPNMHISMKVPGQPLVKVSCVPTGTQAFWNTPLGGQDETRAISFACAPGTTVTPIGLPWGSSLLESEIPLHDWWEGVALDVVHEGTDYGTFSGSLDAVYGDVDPITEREKEEGKDESDSYATFKGGKGKDLLGPNGSTLALTNGIQFGEHATEVVTAESRWWGAP